MLVVEALAEPGQRAVAKLYRSGIPPRSAALQQLSGPAARHVVQRLEYGDAEGIGYELLEYAQYGSLRDWLAQGPLSEAQVREVLIELNAALAELHERHLLHRNLKPEDAGPIDASASGATGGGSGVGIVQIQTGGLAMNSCSTLNTSSGNNTGATCSCNSG